MSLKLKGLPEMIIGYDYVISASQVFLGFVKQFGFEDLVSLDNACVERGPSSDSFDPCHPFWSSRADMTEHLASWDIWPRYEFAVELCYATNGERDWRRGLCEPQTVEGGRDVELLGYDVADEALFSALLNMGSIETNLRKHIGGLTRCLLFEALDTAVSFAEESAMSAKEHAPFYVFGLWNCQRDTDRDSCAG